MKKLDYFSFANGRWIEKKGSDESVVIEKGKLKLVTQNILFDVVKRREDIVKSGKRYEYMMKRFEEEDFDILCLNEVTNTFLSMILTQEWVRRKYYLSTVSFEEGKFGQVLLISSKLPFSSLFEYTYSCMQPLTTCLVGVLGNDLLISCVHFLSLEKNFKIREAQLNEIYEVLEGKEFENVRQKIICGDFNLHKEEESKIIKRGYVDLWANTCDLEKNPGYTFDFLRNKMITRIWNNENRRMRLDRVIMKTEKEDEISSPSFYEPKSFELYLTEEIEPGLFSSDHFGIRYYLEKEK